MSESLIFIAMERHWTWQWHSDPWLLFPGILVFDMATTAFLLLLGRPRIALWMTRIAELGIHRSTIIIKASVLCGGCQMQTAEELPGGRHYSAPGSRKPSIGQLLLYGVSVFRRSTWYFAYAFWIVTSTQAYRTPKNHARLMDVQVEP